MRVLLMPVNICEPEPVTVHPIPQRFSGGRHCWHLMMTLSDTAKVQSPGRSWFWQDTKAQFLAVFLVGSLRPRVARLLHSHLFPCSRRRTGEDDGILKQANDCWEPGGTRINTQFDLRCTLDRGRNPKTGISGHVQLVIHLSHNHNPVLKWSTQNHVKN